MLYSGSLTTRWGSSPIDQPLPTGPSSFMPVQLRSIAQFMPNGADCKSVDWMLGIPSKAPTGASDTPFAIGLGFHGPVGPLPPPESFGPATPGPPVSAGKGQLVGSGGCVFKFVDPKPNRSRDSSDSNATRCD